MAETFQRSPQSVADLQQELAALRLQVARSASREAIQNLMGRYAYFHHANRNDLVPGLFAQKTPGVRVAMAELGTWNGPDAAKRAFGIFADMPDPNPPGMMPIHVQGTPCIEVAGDNQTARGVWMGIGLVVMPDPETGKPKAMWEWDRYGIDFVNEDGEWKFWHFSFANIFRTIWAGFGEDWCSDAAYELPLKIWNKEGKAVLPLAGVPVPDSLLPDGPPVNQAPWTLDTRQELLPVPPTPYETWNENERY